MVVERVAVESCGESGGDAASGHSSAYGLPVTPVGGPAFWVGIDLR